LPAELQPLTDARGEPMGEWTSEPLPGVLGHWARLIVVRANEWSPAVRVGREEEVARAVAKLDLELALFRGCPAGPAMHALRELVEARALLRRDPLTAEMLEAFGWGALVEAQDSTCRRPAEPI
jgi:hypothetical protein